MQLLILAVAVSFAAGGQTRAIKGDIPPTLSGAAQVVWVAADSGDAEPCALDNGQWACGGPPAGHPGIVVILGDSMIAARIVGPSSGGGSASIHRWGRLVRVTPGGVAPEDIHDLLAVAWKPERSAVRPHTQRFLPVEESAIQITQLSGFAFWITGDDAGDDAFVSVDGPAIGRTTIAASALIESPSDAPVFLPADAPLALAGHVIGSHFEPVADAEVELFEPLRRGETSDEDSAEMVRRATTRTDADGAFHIDRLTPGSYTLSAFEPAVGRGTLRVASWSEPAVVRLTPPVRATGRVLRARAPVPGARVRFVPDPAALVASTDVTQLIADAVMTGADGTFALPLPPAHTGTIQIVTPGGISLRVPVVERAGNSDIALGDLAVPEPKRVAVRLLDAASCTLSAVGPLNALGLAIVAPSQAQNVFWFDLPEPGDWALNVECDGKERRTEPAVISVAPSAQDMAIDVRLAQRPGQP